MSTTLRFILSILPFHDSAGSLAGRYLAVLQCRIDEECPLVLNNAQGRKSDGVGSLVSHDDAVRFLLLIAALVKRLCESRARPYRAPHISRL
jgi:hypothetical protein